MIANVRAWCGWKAHDVKFRSIRVRLVCVMSRIVGWRVGSYDKFVSRVASSWADGKLKGEIDFAEGVTQSA